MTTVNVQDQILLNELTANGVYTAHGVLVPTPSPLTSPFATAVAAASILIPASLTYNGTVSGYDFATGQATLIENLNKLTSLTINGEVASAFNNVSLKIKTITINGGVIDSFNRSKINSNLTVTGNIISSFDNSIVEQCSSSKHGCLKLTGNLGISTSNQLALDLQNFIGKYTVAVPPTTTTPLVSTFLTDLTTFYNTLTPSAASPFTVTIQNLALAQMAFTSSVSGFGTFNRSIINYNKIELTGVFAVFSFTESRIKVSQLIIMYSNVYMFFLYCNITGFERCEVPNTSFNLKRWSPIQKILATLTNLALFFPGFLNELFSRCNIETKSFTLTGEYDGRIGRLSVLTAEKINLGVTTQTIANSSLLVFSASLIYCFDCFDVNYPLLSGTTLSVVEFSTIYFNHATIQGEYTQLFHDSFVKGHKAKISGVLGFVVNDFNPATYQVEYTCIDSTFQAALIFQSTLITAKELVFKTDLSSTTSIFNVGAANGGEYGPPVIRVDSLRFENGFVYNDSAQGGNNAIFDLCELIVERPTTSSPVVLSSAFNGSVIEADKIIIKGDVYLSFIAATIKTKCFSAGNTSYSAARALISASETKFRIIGADDSSSSLDSGRITRCDTPAKFIQDTSNSTQIANVDAYITNFFYLTIPVPTLIPLDTNWITNLFSSSSFDASNLNLIYRPKFVNFDITVSSLIPYGQSTPSYSSTQFLANAIIGQLEATVVNGDTISILTTAGPFSALKYLKIVGTATVSQIPLSILATLKELDICTAVAPTSTERKLLRKYHLDI